MAHVQTNQWEIWKSRNKPVVYWNLVKTKVTFPKVGKISIVIVSSTGRSACPWKEAE